VNEGIFRHLEVEKVNEKDAAVYAENMMAYFQFLISKKKEASAHFASLYVKPIYPKAVNFIVRHCPQLVMLMLSYVNGLKQ
jgi:hypothetical protein